MICDFTSLLMVVQHATYMSVMLKSEASSAHALSMNFSVKQDTKLNIFCTFIDFSMRAKEKIAGQGTITDITR